MPEIICTTVYQFSELADAAKDKARRWYRELGPHDDWWTRSTRILSGSAIFSAST